MVLNQTTRAIALPGVAPGDTIQLILEGKVTRRRVVGIVQERHGGGGAYATPAGYAQATGRPVRVNTLRVVTTSRDESTRQEVAAATTATFGRGGVEVASAASVSRQEAISGGHLGPVVLILLGIALPLGVVGLIGLASTMSANVMDRTREFGVLHAIGGRPAAVRRLVVLEGLFLALTSCAVAILPALGLTPCSRRSPRPGSTARQRPGEPVLQRAAPLSHLAACGCGVDRPRPARRHAGHRRRSPPRGPDHGPGGDGLAMTSHSPQPHPRADVSGSCRPARDARSDRLGAP